MSDTTLEAPPKNKLETLKVPPHSIEAEQAVLGGLMLDNNAWDVVVEILEEKDFYRRDHRVIFGHMGKLVANNQPLDLITLSESLEGVGELEKVGGVAYLGELARNTPSAANINAYSDIVKERSTLRQLISVGTEITSDAFEPKGRLSEELVDEAQRKVFEIASHGSSGKSGPHSITKVLGSALEQIETLFKSDDPITGLPTGFKDLDTMTAGLQSGDLVVVAGRPSMGKTVLGVNIAEYAAVKTKKPVLIFSLEMPSEQIAMRMLSSLGRIEQHHLRMGKIADSDWARISSTVGILSEASIFVDDTAGITPNELRTKARRIARDHGQLGLIVVDYLQLMTVPGKSDNRTAEISEISRSLKSLAKELNVPVIALSQLNRSLEQRPNKRPVMADLRESGAIEQDADLILFIYRDEVYNEESPDKGTAEIIIAKHRNGPIGMVRLTFLGHYTRFDNCANPEHYSSEA